MTFILRIEDLPPLSERQERLPVHHALTLHSIDSWDFATTLSPGTPSIYPQIVEESLYTEVGNGVFKMEDHPVREEGRHERRRSKGVYWANEPDIALEEEPFETELLSSSDPSDLEYADPGPSSSTSTDGSSPPSSLPDSTSNQSPQNPKIPIPMDPLRGNTFTHNLPDANPSSYPASKSSADGHRLSSSSSQVGLWQKFKSNVRRPSTRDGPGLDEDEKASARKRMTSLFGDAGKHVMTKTSNHTAQAVGQ
jgi:hypothetical protein